MVNDTDRIIIWSAVPIFNIIGLWGNLNVIYAHYRLPVLRTKYGILLCMLTLSQSICLVFEWVSVIYGLTKINVVRRICFYIISPYLFMHCAQTGLMATISVDLFISIVSPLKHRVVFLQTYLFILCLPTIIYGVLVLIVALTHMNNDTIALCNPPLSLPPLANQIWYLIALIFGGVTITTYILSFSIIYCRKKKRTGQNDHTNGTIERKAMKSLSVLLVIFVFTRYISTVMANIMILMGCDPELIGTVQSYNIYSAMICYSSSYYVCFLRSAEYRKIFWYQITSTAKVVGVSLDENRFGSSEAEPLSQKTMTVRTHH